jgi:transposase
MISPPAGARIFLACGATDMRKGFDGLVSQVERVLGADPYVGALFIFRGRRGDLIKAIYFDGQGLVLFAKRLEKGRFVWPQAKDGMITLTAAQLSMLIEGIDWRMPAWTVRPQPEIHR